ncbi:MAG: DNA-directed RNA polymerase subunit delta [Thomasclavelia sp.]|jgi:DNA-directed RNA polymerase subunit delta|nr:DNA-directed RNA polymerase subunit delta [Thomasclavelia sp.]
MANNKSMVDTAVDILKDKKKEMNFYDLYDAVAKELELDEEGKEDKKSLFYTNITLDGRFITLGENVWDLRTSHKYEDVNIDMNDIYNTDDADEDSEEDDDDDSVEEDDYNN